MLEEVERAFAVVVVVVEVLSTVFVEPPASIEEDENELIGCLSFESYSRSSCMICLICCWRGDVPTSPTMPSSESLKLGVVPVIAAVVAVAVAAAVVVASPGRLLTFTRYIISGSQNSFCHS